MAITAIQRRVARLEEAAGGGGECSDCGGPNDPGDHSCSYEVIFIDPGGPEDREEWCAGCGRQTRIVLRWPEDMP